MALPAPQQRFFSPSPTDQNNDSAALLQQFAEIVKRDAPEKADRDCFLVHPVNAHPDNEPVDQWVINFTRDLENASIQVASDLKHADSNTGLDRAAYQRKLVLELYDAVMMIVTPAFAERLNNGFEGKKDPLVRLEKMQFQLAIKNTQENEDHKVIVIQLGDCEVNLEKFIGRQPDACLSAEQLSYPMLVVKTLKELLDIDQRSKLCETLRYYATGVPASDVIRPETNPQPSTELDMDRIIPRFRSPGFGV